MALSSRTNARRIFVDASHTFKSGLNSGVQRVVRNACALASASAESASVDTITLSQGQFYATDLSRETECRRGVNEIRADVLASMPKSYRVLARALCRVLPFNTLERWMLPKPGHQGMFKMPLKVYERALAIGVNNRLANPGAGDLLLLPDAYWARREIWPAVEEAKKRGAKVAVVLYDLIPLTHPQFVPAKAVAPFKEYLRRVAQHADMTIAISETVKRQIEQLFRQPEYRSQCKHFAAFELGAEFHSTLGDVRPHVREVFAEDAVNAPHLMVATFDPRKNHRYALDAFEKVWETRPNRKLCFVGRTGWLCDDVIERVRNHPRFGQQLFALHDVTDAELNYCYKKARSVLFPSIVEGFGLPIVEALWHGKYVFASDTAIHREVGRDECNYCDLSSAESLAGQILEREASWSEISPSQRSTYRPISWARSIESLVTQCCMTLYPSESAVVVGRAA